jgi:two-component system chemotaxis sensor kinase CheA
MLVGQGQPNRDNQMKSHHLRIDRDIGHIELGVVDYGSLTVVSASRRFYDWVNRPHMERVELLKLIPGLELAAIHQALEEFGGECELEGSFSTADGSSVSLRIRLIKTGQTMVSPLRLLAFDISEIRQREEILRTVSTLLESHKAIIAESRKTLKVLLDSLPQAVFLVDSSLAITSEISRMAAELFGEDFDKASLADLLQCSQADLEPLRLAFDGVEWDLMVEILPREFLFKERIFSISFIPVHDQEVLASVTIVITDVTERRRMEQSLEQTDSDNRALVAILAAKDEFIDLVNLARKATTVADDLHSLSSIVHGLKGGFSFLDCDKFAAMCHQAEDKFVPEVYTPEIGRSFIEQLNSELRAFTNRYQHVLQFESRFDADIALRHLQLDYDAIGRLFSEVEHSGLSPHILDSIERLVELPAQKLLGWLDTAWRKTLVSESKEGNSITWSGEVALAREPYKELFQSFVHIIRNAADHGIESPAERERRGKVRAGSMRIEVSYQDGTYLFTFEDDGAGIDPDALVAIARSRGIHVPETISRQQALMLICEPGFSSRQEVTALSGRGIGVDAVRRAAQLCGGDVSVESTLGAGTKISVWFKRQRYWPPT